MYDSGALTSGRGRGCTKHTHRVRTSTREAVSLGYEHLAIDNGTAMGLSYHCMHVVLTNCIAVAIRSEATLGDL